MEGPGTEAFTGVFFDANGGTGYGGRGFAGHLGTMNVLYVDGHVKAMKPVKTATPINQWGSAGSAACSAFTALERINCTTPDPTNVTAMTEIGANYP